jgi:hypothetical protein
LLQNDDTLGSKKERNEERRKEIQQDEYDEMQEQVLPSLKPWSISKQR